MGFKPSTDDQSFLLFVFLDFTGKESWLEIEKHLSKLNNNTEEGDLVHSYGRNLATCANDDSCKGNECGCASYA